MNTLMPFVTDLVSRTGGREINEDHCGFLELGEAACWVVADGLGGYQGGEAAARLAVEATLNSFRANPQLSTAALQSHLEAAQQTVLQAQKAQPRLSTMRTTIVVLITDSKRAFWAHLGDSRLYCFENGRIVFCTSDHSVVQAMVDAGELSPEQIRHNEDRNRLLRCLGNPDDEIRPTILEQPRNLIRGTSFLMCTDGFWENITETEMEVDFSKAEASGEWLAWMTDRVMERLTEDSDNYTAIVAAFNSAPASHAPSASKLPKVVRSRYTAAKESRLTRTSLSGPLVVAVSVVLLCVSNWFPLFSGKAESSLQVQCEMSVTAPHVQI
jgi:serine/threonine protein phosphatase PrpC